MAEPTTFKVAIACGTAGAFVDVTSELVGQLEWSWGRRSEFDDFVPGSMSFTLDNADGRFTPGNTVAATSAGFGLTLVEGMGVCFQLNTRLVAGTLRKIHPVFEGADPSGSRVKITVDDMLGAPSRRALGYLPSDMVAGAGVYAYWPFTDPEGSSSAAELSGNAHSDLKRVSVVTPPPEVVFEVDGVLGDTQMELSNTTQLAYMRATDFSTIAYESGSMGVWGLWVTSVTGLLVLEIRPEGLSDSFDITVVDNIRLTMGTGGTVSGPTVESGRPYYVSIVVTTSGSLTITGQLFVNGVSYGTKTYNQTGGVPSSLTNAERTPSNVRIQLGDGVNATRMRLSHLSHTASQVHEHYLASGDVGDLYKAIEISVPEMTLAALPSGLSNAEVGLLSGGSALDALNAITRSEQGHIYTSASGTLTAPVQTVVVRERDRPEDVDYTFDIEDDIEDAPELIRDLTNMVSRVRVTGSEVTAEVFDEDLVDRVGSAFTSGNTVLSRRRDVTAWGEDRLLRGANFQQGVRVASFTVNAASTDRWDDLLALTPGDRIKVTGLPSTQLGFSDWEGWLLGVSEAHMYASHPFTLFLAPVLPPAGVFDTAEFDTDSFVF